MMPKNVATMFTDCFFIVSFQRIILLKRISFNINMLPLVDIAVVGAGPSGLFSVLEAGLFKMNCCIIENNYISGGQCSMLYPEKPIYDVPGHKSIISRDFISLLKAQIAPYDPIIYYNHNVKHMDRLINHDREIVELCAYNNDDGSELRIKAHAVIIAIGGGKFIPRRPEIVDIYNFEGESVFYSVQDRSIFTKKRVVLAGGGDTAIDFALDLSEVADKVYIVHRRDNFRCVPEGLSKLCSIAENSNKVEFVIPYQLSDLIGDKVTKKLVGVIVSNTTTQETKILEADMLIPCFGLLNDLKDTANWGVKCSENGQNIIVNHLTMATNVQNIYAIGDIAVYEGKVKSILGGFYEAARACRAIYASLYPNNTIPSNCSRGK